MYFNVFYSRTPVFTILGGKDVTKVVFLDEPTSGMDPYGLTDLVMLEWREGNPL